MFCCFGVCLIWFVWCFFFGCFVVVLAILFVFCFEFGLLRLFLLTFVVLCFDWFGVCQRAALISFGIALSSLF